MCLQQVSSESVIGAGVGPGGRGILIIVALIAQSVALTFLVTLFRLEVYYYGVLSLFSEV